MDEMNVDGIKPKRQRLVQIGEIHLVRTSHHQLLMLTNLKDHTRRTSTDKIVRLYKYHGSCIPTSPYSGINETQEDGSTHWQDGSIKVNLGRRATCNLKQKNSNEFPHQVLMDVYIYIYLSSFFGTCEMHGTQVRYDPTKKWFGRTNRMKSPSYLPLVPPFQGV